MTSDILLDDGADENWVTVQASVFNSKAADLILDSQARRSNDQGPRRALVHNQSDGLTVNFNGDYPGGVTLVEVSTLNMKPRQQHGPEWKLPKSGSIGDLILMIRSEQGPFAPVGGAECTLWLCVGSHVGIARWKEVQMGNAVLGTE